MRPRCGHIIASGAAKVAGTYGERCERPAGHNGSHRSPTASRRARERYRRTGKRRETLRRHYRRHRAEEIYASSRRRLRRRIKEKQERIALLEEEVRRLSA